MGTDKRWISIQSFKHDGSLHRFWDRGFLLLNDEDYIIVATKRAKVIENNGRRWFTKEPAVTIFSKKDWWNVICMLKHDGICYYCNIASPSILENQVVKYIDYDLDAKLFTDGDIRILDEKEYIKHKNTYQYGDELDVILKFTTEKIVKLMKERKYPFVDNSIRDYYAKFLVNTNKETK